MALTSAIAQPPVKVPPAKPADAQDLLLEVEDLHTSFTTEEGHLRAVDGVSFKMRRGQTLALVGESGCGKSVTAYSILGLIQKPGRVEAGRVLFYPRGEESIDVAALGPRDPELYRVRGGLASMIFQEPMAALSPVHTAGDQIAEAILLHQDVTKAQAWERVVEMLGRVGIPNAQLRARQYPHELSGGMRQRVVIAMALVCNPQLLIADEPTTALDVTIQAQILALLKKLQSEIHMGILLITHDLGVVAQMADDVSVMYLGRVVERSDVRTILRRPRHPYTFGLLKSLPSLSQPDQRLPSIAGTVPPLTRLPAGCPFHPRCQFAVEGRCDVGAPPELAQVRLGHDVACPRVHEIEKELRS